MSLGEFSSVTINFITPPVRCKVYQPMELRSNGVRVTPGAISAELQSFNPKTPKSHKAAQKLEDSGHRVLVKKHSMGGTHLRFPVAGLWALSVEYEGKVYTKNIEVYGQRGKHAKLQSKLAHEALHGSTNSDEIESEDSVEDSTSTTNGSVVANNDSSAQSTPRPEPPSPHEQFYRQIYQKSDWNVSQNPGEPAQEQVAGYAERSRWNVAPSYVTFNSQQTIPQPLNYSHMLKQHQQMLQQQQNQQQQQQQNQQQLQHHQHVVQPHISQPSYPSSQLYFNQPQINNHTNSPVFPFQNTQSYAQFASDSNHQQNFNEMQFSDSPLSPITPHMGSSNNFNFPNMNEIDITSTTPESATFACNNIGQYGNATHMKHQEPEISYIQPNAVYYPIPPACSDVVNSFFADQPSSPGSEADSSDSSIAPVVRTGYPFLSKIVPSSTNDVVSLGQEVCLIGQNYVDSDHDANSVYFTLQINQARIRAPIQQSTTTTHVATIPPLSYFGISYATEPLLAIVELFQYSLLVPCEQQFHYLCTSGQLTQLRSKNLLRDDSQAQHGFSNNQLNFGLSGTTNSSETSGDESASSGSFAPCYFFNTGIPTLNTLIVDNNMAAFQELVTKGADVNKKDIWGITPLHLAIFFGRSQMANFLLHTGVEQSLQIEDINGDTPLDLVLRHWDPDIRQLYDVMVSLLRDTSSVEKSSSSSEAVAISERKTSQGASVPASIKKKPSFLTKQATKVPVKTLSKTLPFKLENSCLTILHPSFWEEIHTALSKLASNEKPEGEEALLLNSWSEISKATSIISSGLNLESFPNIPLQAFPLLQELNFSHNSLRFLPNDLIQFKSLAALDMSHNLLDILPRSMADMESLKTFSYSDNPLRLMPSQLIPSPTQSAPELPQDKSPNKSMKTSFDESARQKKNFADWNQSPIKLFLSECKLGESELISDHKVRINILGDSYHDRYVLQKTLQVDFGSFVTRLRHKIPQVVPNDDLSIVDIPNKFANDIFFETWSGGASHPDFACQALVTPGIQIVSFSLARRESKDLGRIQYWIQSIKARLPTAPIILVGCYTETQTNSREVSSFLERIAAIEPVDEIVTISFTNGEGTDSLKKKLVELTQKRSIGTKTYRKNIAMFMESLLQVKQARWFLTRAEFDSLASQFGIDTQRNESFEQVINQLSSFGGILHFGDHTSLLANIIFVDPQRLCHTFTNFYPRYKRLIKDGILHLKDCTSHFVSIIGGAPLVHDNSSAAFATTPVVLLTESTNSSPRAPSPSLLQTKDSPRSSFGDVADLNSHFSESLVLSSKSGRNSKGFLTSPIKTISKPTTQPASPLLGRSLIDDRVLVDLLELFDEAVKLPDDKVLFPSRLSETVSQDLLLQYWSRGPAHSFERVYQFKGSSPPKRLLNQLLCKLYEDPVFEVCLHWSTGVVIRHVDEKAKITMVPGSPIVHIQVVGSLPSMLLPLIVNTMDTLVSYWPNSLAQVLVPCPSLTSTSTTLLREEILDALSNGQHQINRDKFSIRLDLVAPDLCLHDLQALEVEESALEIGSNLSILEALEAESTAPTSIWSQENQYIWKGKLRGYEDVLISHFHYSVDPHMYKTKQDFMDAVSVSCIRALVKCSEEVRKLALLQYPLVARLKAFNLSSQTLATESSPHGLLRTVMSNSPATFTTELKLRMMMEVVQLTNWMHSQGIAIGSFDVDNFLVTCLESKPQQAHLKLCNFGAVKHILSRDYILKQDVQALGVLLWQIWTVSPDSTSFSLDKLAPSGDPLDSEICDLISSCCAPASLRVSIVQVLQHIDYVFSQHGLHHQSVALRSSSLSLPLNASSFSYWKNQDSLRILELNEKEVASISGIVHTADGQVWVACASGFIYMWNPSSPSATTVIQTFSADTRHSRRRINALMTSGSYVWCITDGSICVYSMSGSLVKNITHKQSLCLTKYEPTGNGTYGSAGDGLVYIGGAHGEISVWDTNTFQCTLGVVLENRLPITAIAVGARYLWIGVGVSRRICHVVALNKSTLMEVCRFQAHEDLVSSIVVVDQNQLWTSSFDGKINVWNVTNEKDDKLSVKLEKSIMTHRRPVLKMAAGPRNPDGSTSKVFAADHSAIFVWDTKNAHTIDQHLLGRHRGAIGALCSIDTNTFLSASVEDGCVCLWKRIFPLTGQR